MFKMGDRVRWSSQAGGVRVTKVGVVVEVVPPYTMKRMRSRDPATSRTHESYVVEVAGRTAKRKPVLYWPVASMLSRAPTSRKHAPAPMSPVPMPPMAEPTMLPMAETTMPPMAEPTIDQTKLGDAA